MVEFALILPIFILIFCAIIDFGWIINNELQLSYCANEGARYGAINSTQTNIQSAVSDLVKNSAPSYMQSGLTVTTTITKNSDGSNNDVIVNVSCNIKALTPLTGIFTGSQTINISTQCTMNAE